ncbi:tumor suppressor p53-binding protein 1 [Fopius arisanus]|uniref:Tp53bp1 protein n=1 Tax=Fopius arisanus TaxID=64838 RepID=A0A0C9RXW9_9HYME|nr:PREDICTED: tumor suppressor p53-binding protein 1-like [Fopius arisanus]XP_011302886.1 PREDICTED: tumor suppressor p53-binding protein 1-like [Fopius arisanus]
MSELLDGVIPETQRKDDECPTTNDHDKTENNSTVNESQDFHLIAEDETQAESIVQATGGSKGDVNVESSQHEANAKAPPEARASDKDKAVIEPESPSRPIDNQNQEADDNDEDIIQCTPEEIMTPRRRQLNTGGQKRKADEEVDQGGKFQRTSSREDALASVRKKLDEESQQAEVPEASMTDSPPVPGAPLEEKPVASTKPQETLITEDTSKTPMEVDPTPEPPSSTPEKPSDPSPLGPTDRTPEKMETESSTHAPKPDTTKKSRMSIEVIYDKARAPPPKPKELVEIDEDGEKIILDASQEDSTPKDPSYETCETKSATDSYKSVPSVKECDTTDNQLPNGTDIKAQGSDTTLSISVSTNESSGPLKTPSKPPELLNLVSDSEGDSFMNEEKPKATIIPVEKELNLVVKVKCLLQVNESTKEVSGKEFLSIDFEHCPELHVSRRRNSDVSALADVSDNKDPTSPGSVTSNPQPYTLGPSRLSLMSSASTSSSSSSGSGKTLKDANQFSLPRGIPKHAKKPLENIDETTEKIKKEWKNVYLLTSGILNFVNAEVLACDLLNGTTEETLGRLTASTPEAAVVATPKSSKKGRLPKRSRQNSRSSRTNGLGKMSPSVLSTIESKSDTEGNESLISEISTPSRQSGRSLSILRNQTPVYDPSDALVGKECFAKWSDNNYYPGKVISKSKGKFKVNFLDGKNKMLIEEFVIPMLRTLGEGLSVYAMTPEEYGSCGIIVAVEKVKDEVLYTVETDEGEKIKVPIKDIFLTADQAQFLREVVDNDVKSPPSTPSMGKVTMDNIVEGSRRNKSSVLGTPKSGRSKRSSKSTDIEASGSGVLLKKKEESGSDSCFSGDNTDVEGVQLELVETPNDMATKGPASRVKGKAKGRKKEDQEIIATLGPVPEGSSLFKGLSFILTCAPLESLDRYKVEKVESANSETETENEAEWSRIPFVRERLTAQITGCGGKVYEEFKDIPVEEYKNTKLITNVPNITAKSLLCLSVGIHPVNHRWVIRCCQENKLVNASEETLPAGWSFDKEAYVDMYQRPNAKPLGHAVIVMPKIPSNERSIKFWQRVIVNAGGAFRAIENQTETFMEGTVVLANGKCPNWMKEKAAGWKIPLVTTTWLVQSLIEGKMMPYGAHPLYQHNYPKK